MIYEQAFLINQTANMHFSEEQQGRRKSVLFVKIIILGKNQNETNQTPPPPLRKKINIILLEYWHSIHTSTFNNHKNG